MYKPPYTITEKILYLCSHIQKQIGRFEGISIQATEPKLRKQNQIKTIHGSCAIEGNTLSIEQVTALFNNKRVMGPKKDIIEIQNAIEAYQSIKQFNEFSSESLLKAHKIMMKGLIDDAGKWRKTGVGVYGDKKILHMAPPAGQVHGLMKDLFNWLAKAKSVDPIVRSAIFHYEFEFIHPFSDGNGRLGRLWQHVLLVKLHPLFEMIPMESIIKERQKEYYQAIQQSSHVGSIEIFIEYSLETILEALNNTLIEIKPKKLKPMQRLEKFYLIQKGTPFARKDYLKLFPDMNTHTASHDLALAVKTNLVKKSGQLKYTRYQFIKQPKG